MASDHDYVRYNGDNLAPRFCYLDKDEVPVDLLGAVWRFHPGVCAYVEEDGEDVWIASVSVRINGTHTETVRVPVSSLIDALRFRITRHSGHEVLIPRDYA